MKLGLGVLTLQLSFQGGAETQGCLQGPCGKFTECSILSEDWGSSVGMGDNAWCWCGCQVVTRGCASGNLHSKTLGMVWVSYHS